MYKVLNGAVAWTPAILRQLAIREKEAPLKEDRRRQSNEWKIVASYSLEFMFPRGDPVSGHIAQGH